MADRLALRNSFYLLRHGQSLANKQCLIVSDPTIGIDGFGLSRAGLEEVSSSMQSRKLELRNVSCIYASDFLRTRQTAEIAAEALNAPVEFSPRLRERGFGEWEGTTNTNYQRVWERDSEDASHRNRNVESVASVAERMVGLLMQIDQSNTAETFLLVSHGDPLQILIAAAGGIDLRRHREIEPLMTAEVRRLESGARSL